MLPKLVTRKILRLSKSSFPAVKSASITTFLRLSTTSKIHRVQYIIHGASYDGRVSVSRRNISKMLDGHAPTAIRTPVSAKREVME